MFNNQFTDEEIRHHHDELIKEAEFYNQHKHIRITEARMLRWYSLLLLLAVVVVALLL